MKKVSLSLVALLCCLFFCLEASAFWIWTPKTKKLINPKYAVKDTPEEQFKWAMKFYEKKDYKRAAEEFARLANHYKESDIAPEAQYYAGRSYETDNRPYPAFQAYQKVIVSYPFTERINEIIERQYNLGNILYKKHSGKLLGKEIMTDLDRAAEVFRTLKENVPFGEYADQAQFMIGECYKKSEQYNEASKEFQKLINEYPRSKLADKSKYEVAQCTYLASLKPDYDQELTDEAIAGFREISEKGRGLGIADDAKKAIARLENKKAKSIFNIAKFYERNKHYKSAAIYYEEVIRKYPRSPFGESAREKLKEINEIIADKELKSVSKPKRKAKKWIFF